VITSPLLQLPNTYRALYGRFATLRPFQLEVMAPLLHGQDLILQAATGSGKTEAVLAPCLERVIRARETEAVLYVVPTRALALDLHRRLATLLSERLGLRLGIRTGDFKRLPGGQADLLLTTPESLDVMLGSPNRQVRTFLQRVSMVVIDEIHQLLQGYRGCQLVYVLQRLEQRQRRPLQKIAMSATLEAPQLIRQTLGFRPDTVCIGDAVQRRVQPHLVQLRREQAELVAFIDDLAQRFGYRKLLLFANSRSQCDRLFAMLRQRGAFRHATYLHYSNLKPHQRRDVERQFHRRSQGLCIATSTLELGIDVGDVDGVVLYEPPDSVTTFLQRLGRANRRQRETSFWGICRGPQAGAQLLQFIALCTLAQQGVVERTHPTRLPSVLVQQILSYLYERKNVTLDTLQALGTDQTETLRALLAEMVRQRWLRPDDGRGREHVWRGSVRYAQALRARQIWSNFPDTDVSYTLQVDDEAVADLPTAIVRQLEVGDLVDLAGKRLQILDIQSGDVKMVRGMPVDAPEGKEVFWVGSGAPVSWEVAQAMRPLLAPDYELDTAVAPGLFSRTRRLWHEQRKQAERQVVLHNGVALSRTPLGGYRYATYLGTVGNIIVQHTLRSYYESRLEEFHCTSDAVAVECSHRVDLQPLPLPVGREAFRDWAARHLQALQAQFPFSVFARALPKALLVDEATVFLWDERLSETFQHYLQASSDIAAGDPRLLEWDANLGSEPAPQIQTPVRQGPQPTALAQERHRLGLTAGGPAQLPDVPAVHRTPRALTGTMVGNYMQHRQCARLLSFDLLPFAQQPPQRTMVDRPVGALRAAQGQDFEARVVAWLEQGTPVYRIAERQTDGTPLALRQRQARAFARLAEIVRQCAARQGEVCQGDEPLAYLAQAALVVPRFLEPTLSPTEGEGDGERDPAYLTSVPDGVGIPDLIEVTVSEGIVWLTVADVKDSPAPSYSQKWQVAFYAALLQRCLQRFSLALPVRLAPQGVVFTRPQQPDVAATRHSFDLAPFLAVLPMLRQHVTEVLTTPVLDAPWQVQRHCASCAYLDTCARQALSTDDIMLTPHLTPGEHCKLRSMGLSTLTQADQWWQDRGGGESTAPLTPQQAVTLRGRVHALATNHLYVLSDTTALYPANISTAVFVHLLRDAASGRPRAWGLHRLSVHQPAPDDPPQCWIATAETDIPACQEAFMARLRAWWQQAIGAESGPHLFTFGTTSLQLLQETLGDSDTALGIDFLRAAEHPRHTDLRRILRQHFALPAPLGINLATAARLWGLTPELPAPASILLDESDDTQELLLHGNPNADQEAQLRAYVRTHLTLQQRLWQVCADHLRSTWEQSGWQPEPEPPPEQALERRCVSFLEHQQQWREQDILAVQQLPLPERLERYRALGPLRFQETSLDSEGRFLYHFQLPAEAPPARFRVGDFLKLNPLGSPDLQQGFAVILARYEPHARRLAVVTRRGQPVLQSQRQYSLDEDVEDWTTPRTLHAVREALTPGKHPRLTGLLAGALSVRQPPARLAWAQHWVKHLGLNQRQQEALLLPFRSSMGLIEGPPGTGKTHVLAWMLIGLVLEAQQASRPLRLAVSALTHRAIDNVLQKVQELLRGPVGAGFPGRCLKWGRRLSLTPDADGDATQLTYVDHADEVVRTPYIILGATGYGLYQLFDSQSGAFPAFFDWVVFDEASQVVVPQALLSLVYGKGQYVFCGDVRQLPPVILGPQQQADDEWPGRSILTHLRGAYGPEVWVRLNETYRLNQELCALPSRLWYEGDLRPVATHARARLSVPVPCEPDRIDHILDPQRPVTLVLVEHHTDHQHSVCEAEVIAQMAARLLLDYRLAPDSLAIVAPHRAQNTTIAQLLARRLEQAEADVALPVIDTVERLQGAEREVLLFSTTTSDPDHLENPFLNHANRFNVAMTRARRKLVVVGSRAFFTQVPHTDEGLTAHHAFSEFYHYCRQHGALFVWPSEEPR
jgi:superfamily II DNA/RNA helicase